MYILKKIIYILYVIYFLTHSFLFIYLLDFKDYNLIFHRQIVSYQIIKQKYSLDVLTIIYNVIINKKFDILKCGIKVQI